MAEKEKALDAEAEDRRVEDELTVPPPLEHDSSNASTPLSDHEHIEPAPEREQLQVTFKRFNNHDPYVAAVSDDAYIPPHHVLTLTSRATRFGQSLYHAGARSFNNQAGDDNNNNKDEETKNVGRRPKTHGRQLSAASAMNGGAAGSIADRASIRTMVSVHLPSWFGDFTARRSQQQSIMPLLSFKNPWRSFDPPGLVTATQGGLRWGLPEGYVEGGRHQSRYRARGRSMKQTEQETAQLDVNVVSPTWNDHTDAQRNSNIRITWLGHATTLVQLPNGLNIMFDPIFAYRASPSQSAGPYRFTSPPCKIEDLPDIDVVCISHNHYDHLSWDCIKKLRKRQKLRGGLKIFCPLGNVGFFREAGFAKDDVCEMDWWDESSVSRVGMTGTVKVICTPAQHGSGRSGGDQSISLWSSWLVSYTHQGSEAQKRIFFAGDTGFRSRTKMRRPRSDFPVCPAFRDISLRYGVPQVMLMPISVGSSLSYFRGWDPFPRRFSPFPRVESAMTSAIHMDAEDAVDCHTSMSLARDESDEARKARQDNPDGGVTSIAVHFGTFVRNEEQTRADVRDLRRSCRERNVRFERLSPPPPSSNDNTTKDAATMAHKDDGSATKEKEDERNGRFLVSHQGETVFIPL